MNEEKCQVEMRSRPNRPPRWRAAVESALLAGLGWLAAAMLNLDGVLGLTGGWLLTVAIGLGALAGFAGLGRIVGALAGTGLALVLVVSWVPYFGRLARDWIRTDPLPRSPVDAIVVLSASVTTDGDLNVEGADRLLEGLSLYRTGYAPTLVVSRTINPANQRSSDEGQSRLYEATGLQPRVFILDPVGTTRLEAVRAAELAPANGWHRIIVVTSPVHTRRACAAFEKVGFEVICRPSRDRSMAVYFQLGPEDRLRAFGEWLYEALGWRRYRLAGWVG